MIRVVQLVTVVLAFALCTPHLVHDVTAQVASESRSIMYRLYTSYILMICVLTKPASLHILANHSDCNTIVKYH